MINCIQYLAVANWMAHAQIRALQMVFDATLFSLKKFILYMISSMSVYRISSMCWDIYIKNVFHLFCNICFIEFQPNETSAAIWIWFSRRFFPIHHPHIHSLTQSHRLKLAYKTHPDSRCTFEYFTSTANS